MRRLTIVQIESFYSQFLDGFYERRTALKTESFQSQINALLDSGYSGGHNLVPYLNPQIWDTHYIVVNCSHSQFRWAEERRRILPDLRSILAAQLEALKPDILYLSDIPGFDFEILNSLRKRPIVVGWHATIVDERINWKQIDLVLSGVKHIRQRACELGAKAAARFMPAAPVYRNPLVSGPAQRLDLVFSGSFVGFIHSERAIQYRLLSKQIGKHQIDIYTGAQFHTTNDEHINFHAPVFGSDVLDLYSRSSIVLDSRGEFNLDDHGTQRETSNMRIFEATRAGAMLLTENCKNLCDYFVPGKEIITYDSTEDLIDKTNFYLSPRNSRLQHKISAAGHARVCNEHLVEHRAAWLERIFEDAFDLGLVRSQKGTDQVDKAFQHIFCTSLDATDFIFGLCAVESLLNRFPGLVVVVLCKDKESYEQMHALKFNVSLVELSEVLPADELHCEGSAPGKLESLPAWLIRNVMNWYPGAVRITYIDPSLQVTDGAVLKFSANDDSIYLLDYQFGPAYAYAQEQLGACSLNLLSVKNGAAARAFLNSVIRLKDATAIDSDGGHSSLTGSPLDALVDECERARTSIVRLGVGAPWSYPENIRDVESDGPIAGNQNRQGLFLFVLVRRRLTGTYELLSYPEHPSWPDCYQKMYIPYFLGLEALIRKYLSDHPIGDQSLSNADVRLAPLLLRRFQLAERGYRLLAKHEYLGAATSIDGWNNQEAAITQHKAFSYLIEEYRKGNRRADLLGLAGILSKIAKPGMQLLETGCGSGYNNTFIREAVPVDYDYAGVDLAAQMISLARETFPALSFEIMSSAHLDYPDDRFDVVLNGASLMHTIEYEMAIRESARVAKTYVVFHTVTVADTEDNTYFEKNAYGSPVVEVCFSEARLSRLLEQNQLQPLLLEKSIDYDLEQIVGHPTRSVSLACLRLNPEPPTTRIPENYNYYCIYFDANYLPRALLTIESLTRHDPRAYFFVLCLDDVTESFIKSYAPHVKAIGVAELEAADPAFAEAKNNRSLIEWYFTATSVLPHYLFTLFPTMNRVTYLDSDLYFYTSPAILHEESKDKSVQIIEHRFSPHLTHLERYGRFNVAWISFFNSEEGRRVVEDYRAECLEWCYDRLEDEKFADQKYLDKWPERYPGCCVSRWLGADVAHWNIGQWEVSYFAKNIFVNAERLLFYHFQGVKRLESGEYWAGADPKHFGIYWNLLYEPYLSAINSMEKRLENVLCNAVRKTIRHKAV